LPIRAWLGAGAMNSPLRCRAAVSIEIEGPPPIAQAPACPFLVGGARSCCLAGVFLGWTLSTLKGNTPHHMTGCAIFRAAFGVVPRR
jgi:hypothetical protein